MSRSAGLDFPCEMPWQDLGRNGFMVWMFRRYFVEYDVRHFPYIVYKNVHTYDLRCMQVCIKTLFIVFVAAVGKTEVMILADVGEDLTTKPKTCIYDAPKP